jgi:hypothetical protein
MPHKDPDKRREYQKNYKRRQRARDRLYNPGQSEGVKAYVCWKIPNYRLPGIVFKNCLFVTADPEEQASIEADELYKIDIFELRLVK